MRHDAFKANCKGLVESGEVNEPAEEEVSTDDKSNSSPQSFIQQVENKRVTVTIKSQELLNKLSATAGAPSYEKVYIQSRKLTIGPNLESGVGKMYCSLKAILFASLNAPYTIDPNKVKETNFFGNATIRMVVEETFYVECEKVSAPTMSVEDLRDIFGDLITIEVM